MGKRTTKALRVRLAKLEAAREFAKNTLGREVTDREAVDFCLGQVNDDTFNATLDHLAGIVQRDTLWLLRVALERLVPEAAFEVGSARGGAVIVRRRTDGTDDESYPWMQFIPAKTGREWMAEAQLSVN